MMEGEKELRHFFNNVLVYLGIYDWYLNIVYNSSEGYCWKRQRRIDIGEFSENPKRLILHEIAHINTCRFCNNKHSYSFWREYQFLIDKFLSNELDDRTEEMYKDLIGSVGRYKLCYKS